MGTLIDLTNQRFGKLVVLHRVQVPAKLKSKQARWACLCDCGNSHEAVSDNLRSGNTTTCGCETGKLIGISKIRHGHALAGNATPEYVIWNGMRSRCGNPNHPAWQDYGARGIFVCDRWSADFLAFLSDMGTRPSKEHTLDRIDNDGPYSKENCRWATRVQQARNRRSSTSVTWHEQTKTVAEWSDVTGLNYQTITTRLRNGWAIDRALSTPAGPDLFRSKVKGLYLEEIEGRQLREAAE